LVLGAWCLHPTFQWTVSVAHSPTLLMPLAILCRTTMKMP